MMNTSNPFSSHLLNGIKQFLFFVFLIVSFFFFSILESKAAGNFNIVNVDTSFGLKISETPSYCLESSTEKIPPVNNFITFKGEMNDGSFIKAAGIKPFWLRVVVNNTTGTDQECVVKIYGYGNQIKAVLDNNGTQNDCNFSESMYNSGYFFPGGKLTFKPGQNILFLHFKSAWGKYDFGVDVISSKNSKTDKAKFIENRFGIILTLFAFLFLIIFQIFYVLIQYYYHRKREYLEYFFYIFCIGVYFFLRLDMIANFQIMSRISIHILPVLNEVTLIIPYTFYLRFSRSFIGMETRFPEIQKQIKKVEWINILFLIPVLILHFYGLTDILIITTVIFVMLLFLYTMFLVRYFYLRRDSIIRFLLAGSVCAATGHVLAMSFNLIPGLYSLFDFPPFYFTMTGLIFEIFFFNTGLGYKAKYEQIEKLKAQAVIIDQLDKNKKMQENMLGMRDRIANDLHDDVGSTLSSIGLYSEVALKNLETENNPEQVKSILKKISESAQRMMESMNEIVWAIHSKNDPGEGLITRIKNIASDRLGHTGIRFSIVATPEFDSIQFTMEARRNIILFFKEALNNAAKYSKATHVNCELKLENNKLLIFINDDGIGFERDAAKKGNGMSSMHSRVQIMNGFLKVDSSPNTGTHLKIELPFSGLVHS